MRRAPAVVAALLAATGTSCGGGQPEGTGPPGTISTLAGTCGTSGNEGDGGPAADALFTTPEAIEVTADGIVYVGDQDAHVVRRIDGSGVVRTFAGTGERGYDGDRGPAAEARLSLPVGLALDEEQSLYIADLVNNAIRRVDSAGAIATIAGTGERGFSGDGGPATGAALNWPTDIAVGARDELYVVDHEGNRIRRIAPDGTITTVAGTGEPGYSGDGGAAAEAELANPAGIAADGEGNVYVTDRDNNRIRRIDPSGVITTVAGTGQSGYSGDGGPAEEAELTAPDHIWIDSAGNLYVGDRGNNVVRRIDPAGAIVTVAGNGDPGFGGDGGPATEASLSSPGGIAVDGSGKLYIADTNNSCIRVVEPAD